MINGASMGVAALAVLAMGPSLVRDLADWLCARRGHRLHRQRLLSMAKGGSFCLVRRSCACGRKHVLVRIRRP